MHMSRVTRSIQDRLLIQIAHILEAHWKKLRTRTSVSARKSISAGVV
jgi:hypothetical protein